jgi:hypothetical protein
MHDELGFLTEAGVQALHASGAIKPLYPVETESLYDKWRCDLYDWSQFDPKEYGYQVIRLSGPDGFFTVVSLRDYARVSTHKWKPRIIYAKDSNGEYTDVITRVDACRSTSVDGVDCTIYLHRFLAGAGPGVDVDHGGGCPLDNRRPRLRCTNRSMNNHNWTFRTRTVHTELPRGVVWGDGRKGKTKTVRGIIWWSVGGKRKVKRSKSMLHTPENVEKAHRWYLRERNKLYGHNKWAVGGKSVPELRFPPRKVVYQFDYSAEESSLVATF